MAVTVVKKRDKMGTLISSSYRWSDPTCPEKIQLKYKYHIIWKYS